MKKIILIILLTPLLIYSQKSINYKEFNTGVYLGPDIIVFPGASFLWGKTIYYDNNILLDYEAGLAFPTLITAKLGLGIGNDNKAGIIGFRPWPTSLYFQYNFNKKRIFSIEFMVPYRNNFSTGMKWPIILNYGWRW